MIKKIFIISLVIGASLGMKAQTSSESIALKDTLDPKLRKGVFPKKAIDRLEQFNISGYYRFVTNYRHLDIAYPHLENNRNNIFVGDDSQIPQLSMNISGSVSPNTSFGTDLYVWSPMTGQGMIENVKGLNLGVSLYGNFSTKLGNFNVQTGGINWYELSPFTFQANRGYNRYTLFERNPWDPNTAKMYSRYDDFYASGAMGQDTRWGKQAFQGIILSGADMPHGFSGSFMFGKSQLNGGLTPLTNMSTGGRIAKSFGAKNSISYNTFNSNSYEDSTESNNIGFNMHTLEYFLGVKSWVFRGEVGMGRTFSQGIKEDWGQALSFKFSKTIKKDHSIEAHIYSISPKVLNNNSIFINSAIAPSYFQTNNQDNQAVLPAVASAMVNIGQLTNNRQGFDLNAFTTIGKKLKLSLGTSMSSEIEKLSSQITYGHPVNGQVLPHFWRWDFPSNVGPYGNLSKVYRSVYETVNITDIDSDGRPEYLKRFSNMEFNAKLKGRLANKKYYLFYLGQFASAQRNWSPITVFTEDAYIRTYYHQLEYYWVLHPKFIWSLFGGYERILGNYNTQVDALTRRPKNQTGTSLAMGADIRMSKNTGLYLRQRWFNYKDTSFELDKYKGFETTLEIKIFF